MTTFAHRIPPHVQTKLAAAASAEARGQFYTALQHLERAHILGQLATGEHVRVHWHMFRFAVRNQPAGEAFGQTWRMLGAGLFTAVGLVPQGNTGGAAVSGFRRMPIPEDLQAVLDAARGEQPRIAQRAATHCAASSHAALR